MDVRVHNNTNVLLKIVKMEYAWDLNLVTPVIVTKTVMLKCFVKQIKCGHSQDSVQNWELLMNSVVKQMNVPFLIIVGTLQTQTVDKKLSLVYHCTVRIMELVLDGIVKMLEIPHLQIIN